MKKRALSLLVVFVAVLTAATELAWEKGFSAKLTGRQEVPSVKTKATGKVLFKLSRDKKELHYKLMVRNIVDANAAHIHKGKKGESGPPLVNLFTGPKKEGKFSGKLAEGMITEKDLSGDLQGKSVEDLVKLMKSGDTYVNVHTDAHPDGEIRGQLR